MSAREWKPGTVAVATVRGTSNVRVMAVSEDDAKVAWVSIHPVQWDGYHDLEHVTDIRPLVVLDPADKKQVDQLIGAFHMATGGAVVSTKEARFALQRMIAPPKPPEPLGLGAVVETDGGTRFVRLPDGYWTSEDESQPWANVNAVRVLSEGVTA